MRAGLTAFRRLSLLPQALGAAFLLLAMGAAQGQAWHQEPRVKGDAAFKAGRYRAAYEHWRDGTLRSDAESHERLARLLSGPHAKSLKPSQRKRSAAITHMYIAAVAGRPSAMDMLSKALRSGTAGAGKVPAAASCWARAPRDTAAITRCVALTGFREQRSRPRCMELLDSAWTSPSNGKSHALLCLANRTPALIASGPPPGPRDEMRWKEYQQHGIELALLGHHWDEPFAKYVEEFNATMVGGVEAAMGSGYLLRLHQDIEKRIDARYPRQTSD